jgi:ATP-dependent Clp protease ATP-binding subunit ClpC
MDHSLLAGDGAGIDAAFVHHSAQRRLVDVRIRDDPSVLALQALLERRQTERCESKDLSAAGLAQMLNAAVFYQSAALDSIAVAVALGLSGLGVRERGPVASLGLFGPTGCGKTETARQLCHAIGSGERPVIRLDMTEYSDQTAPSRLIGSNRGYVGYGDRSTLLTTQVRMSPDAVVIFDEFEKAHPAVQDLLLQVFEEGSLTDGSGVRVSFDHTIVVLTSNLGASTLGRRAPGFQATTPSTFDDRATILDGVRRGLRPELLGRLDVLAVFDRLSVAALEEIASLKLTKWARRASSAGWTLEILPEISPALVAATSREAGARGLQRSIDRMLVRPLLELTPGSYVASVHDDAVKWTPRLGASGANTRTRKDPGESK